MFFLYVCKCTACTLVPLEARRGSWVLWKWNYEQHPHECWALNLIFLQEKQVLLTTGLSSSQSTVANSKYKALFVS